MQNIGNMAKICRDIMFMRKFMAIYHYDHYDNACPGKLC